MKPRLFDYIPKDEVWMVPPELQEPAPEESVESWISRVVAAARAGRIAVIKNVGASR
jgi:hypothetical protein